jgi:phosphoribosyl-AMP cyclohydrolase
VNVGDLAPEQLERIVVRIRSEERGVIGVAVFGSYARGEATPQSDLDLEAILRAEPRIGYRTWFDGELHVSVGFDSVAELEREKTRPASWPLKLAAALPAAWIWATDEARADVGDPPDFSRPAGQPELEDFVEWCGKTLRAADPLALRVAARGLAEEAPALLGHLNGSPSVATRVEAVRVACAFAVAPDGWHDDLLVLLGYVPAADASVREAAERVGRGMLALLRKRGFESPQPYLTQYLHDGTLERHLGFS